jgi:hypothetical protein
MRTSASRLMLTVLLYPWLAHSQTPNSAIKGEVIDGATLEGLAGARVRLQCGQEDPAFTRADASGRFQFAGIQPAEDCLLRAEYPGYMPSGAGPRNSSGGTPARSDVPVPLVLRRYGVIAGRVLDADGLPAPGAQIELYLRLPKGAPPRIAGLRTGPLEQGHYEYWPFLGGLATTGDLGEFRIAMLPAGTYAICAYGQDSPLLRGDTRYRPTFYAHSISPAGAAPIEVVEGKETAGVDTKLVRATGVTVSGRVLGLPPPGSDPPLATGVTMWPEAETRPRSVSSAAVANGRFEVKDVLPGRYVLAALTVKTARQGPPLEDAALGAERVVEVGDRAVGGLKVAMQPVRDIPGALSFENGCATEPLAVWIEEPGIGRPIHANAETDGTFALRHVPPGVYLLVLVRDNVRVFPTSVLLGNRKVDVDAALVVNAKTAGPLRIRVGCGLPPQTKREMP